MGAASSKSENVVRQNLANIVSTSCAPTSCEAIEEGTEINITGSTISGVQFNQMCSASGECVNKTLIDATLDSLVEGSASAEQSLSNTMGISISDVQNMTASNLENIIKNKCEGTTTDLIRKDFTVNISGGAYVSGTEFNQIGNASQKCYFDNLMNAAVAAESVAETRAGKSKESNVAIIFVVIALLVLLMIGGMVYMKMKRR